MAPAVLHNCDVVLSASHSPMSTERNIGELSPSGSSAGPQAWTPEEVRGDDVGAGLAISVIPDKRRPGWSVCPGKTTRRAIRNPDLRSRIWALSLDSGFRRNDGEGGILPSCHSLISTAWTIGGLSPPGSRAGPQVWTPEQVRGDDVGGHLSI